MNKKLLILSLPSILSLIPVTGNAAIRIGNQSRSYADAYQQVMMTQQQADYYNQQAEAATPDTLPVRVADQDIANQIAKTGTSSSGLDRGTLDSCAMIYPGGTFAWDTPTAGSKVGSSRTCVAVVEMRVINGTEDVVVARANVAAGDAIECNISKFPHATYLPEAASVTFPADSEPTVDDVIKVMNNEQKKNAGLKIAAGVLLGGVGGNLATGKNPDGKKDAGGTVIGALTGGGLMAGNAYAGKVAGDVILSTGVNAAAGGVIGNIVATGDSVLRIENCEVDGVKTKCLWGVVQKSQPLTDYEVAFYNISGNETVVCKKITETTFDSCRKEEVTNLSFDEYENIEKGMNDSNFLKIQQKYESQFSYDPDTRTMRARDFNNPYGIWIRAKDGSAGRPTQRMAAMIPEFQDKTFGVKMSDWYKWRTTNGSWAKITGRDNKGNPAALPGGEYSIYEFYPMVVDASDGGIIDIGNKARAKSTAIGAGAGAALGGFSAYQGANDEVDTRWISAVTEYKDSLQKVYCATGTRFLSFYNDVAIIPNMR